jgi:aminoglycoside phosphotransferase (APT) family kinase protein
VAEHQVAPGANIAHPRCTVAVARWLESADYPAVRTIDVDQPVVIDGQAVTFWEAVSNDGDEYASTGEIAEVLAKLHSLTAPDDLHLSELSPFANAAQRIEANTWLNPDDRSFLAATLAQMQAEYRKLEFVLPPGVIHGDASVGNVLHDTQGNPVVIDLDGFAIGPRERDLALTAVYYDSFGWLPGHAIGPRVPDGHLGHPESRRDREGCRGGRQADLGAAHRRQPQRLAALQGGSLTSHIPANVSVSGRSL